jgi:hypothetical protein
VRCNTTLSPGPSHGCTASMQVITIPLHLQHPAAAYSSRSLYIHGVTTAGTLGNGSANKRALPQRPKLVPQHSNNILCSHTHSTFLRRNRQKHTQKARQFDSSNRCCCNSCAELLALTQTDRANACTALQLGSTPHYSDSACTVSAPQNVP